MSAYVLHTEVTRAILDSIKIGDLVKVNDWKAPLRIKGVSENYAVMATNCFGKSLYSVIEKTPWAGIRYNAMRGGCFHCGTDDLLFGSANFDYDFDDAEAVSRYLGEFERGETHLSQRNAIPIMQIQIKGAGS